VSLSKRIAYDTRNEINRITNDILRDNGFLREAGVELEKRAVMRPTNQNLLSLSQLHSEENSELITGWFRELFALHPANKAWRQFKGTERGSRRHYFIHQDKANGLAIIAWLKLQGGE
jgi:hypothetical protein